MVTGTRGPKLTILEKEGVFDEIVIWRRAETRRETFIRIAAN